MDWLSHRRKLCRYSAGLSEPRDILIRFSLNHLLGQMQASPGQRRLHPAVAIAAMISLECPRRSRSEPPYRLNLEPGVEADVVTIGCG